MPSTSKASSRQERATSSNPICGKLFADADLVTRQLIDDVLKYKRLDGVQEALRKIADAVFPGGKQALVLREKLAQLSMPLLIVWGSDDRIIDSSQARGFADQRTRRDHSRSRPYGADGSCGRAQSRRR